MNDRLEQTTQEIFDLEKLWLYERFPMLGLAAADLKPSFFEDAPTGTDGEFLYYCPRNLFPEYLEGRFHRISLHLLFHCLYLHILPLENPAPDLWNLACDLFVSRLADRLLPEETEAFSKRQELYRRLETSLSWHSAQSLYQSLLKTPVSIDGTLFQADSHQFWYPAGRPCAPGSGSENGQSGQGASSPSRLEKLEHIRRKWQRIRLSIQSSSRKPPSRGAASGSRLEWLLLEEQGRYDFRRYLKKFAVTGEEMQTDLDSFDYIPYYYGLTHYQNMPFIEPNESCETAKVQELVIAIDTSGSCSLPVVQRFLEETRSILTDRQNFFRHMNVHILQCDSMIQQHTAIHSPEDWQQFSQNLKILGRGGTDFTPVFTFVEKLRRQGELKNLKGLLYFTDGDGIYPTAPPDYETAFVFTDYRFLDYKVPPWAVRLCLELPEVLQKSFS
ncbi:MAG: VWA-like domain-containing protein [Eubacteriales bacterium]|nr:VWA-like domain-containing protein [Eubacteriales bacterium]